MTSPRSPGELFWAFTLIALQGFGGVLAVLQNAIVERRRWMTKPEFAEQLSIAQILPGPNVVNMALMIGDRHFGWRGAAAALAGMITVPLLIVLALSVAYRELATHPQAAGALRGMAAVAAGLVLGMAFKLMPALKGNLNGPWVCGVVTVLSVVAAAVLRLPLWVIVLGIGGGSWALAWWRLGREQTTATAEARSPSQDESP